jgi:hypothetical protein
VSITQMERKRDTDAPAVITTSWKCQSQRNQISHGLMNTGTKLLRHDEPSSRRRKSRGRIREMNNKNPNDNKFHAGAKDGKHYWITPPELYELLNKEFHFDFDPCPFPLPVGFDGLTCEWGSSNYINPPFGSIVHLGKKKGPTAWARKAIEEYHKGKRIVFVFPIDGWVLMMLSEGAVVRNLGDIRWLSTEDGLPGNGAGRPIACFILDPKQEVKGKEANDGKV